MKTISKFFILLMAVTTLAACVDSDAGKMQGSKAADKVSGYNNQNQ